MIEMMREIRRLQDQIDALRTIELGGVWYDWTPTIVGFSTDPTNTIYRYCVIGKLCHINIRQLTAGTSNNTIFTISLPINAVTITNMVWSGTSRVADNGVIQSAPGLLEIVSGGTVINCYKDYNAAAWTSSGAKRVLNGFIEYEI